MRSISTSTGLSRVPGRCYHSPVVSQQAIARCSITGHIPALTIDRFHHLYCCLLLSVSGTQLATTDGRYSHWIHNCGTVADCLFLILCSLLPCQHLLVLSDCWSRNCCCQYETSSVLTASTGLASLLQHVEKLMILPRSRCLERRSHACRWW